MEETDPDASLVFSFNETYDIPPGNEFFQILFLQSGYETKVINDIVFYRSYLSDILDCWVKIRDIQQQLITYVNPPIIELIFHLIFFRHHWITKQR